MKKHEKVFIGLHIPKTAGMTLINLLINKLGNQSFLPYSSHLENADNEIPFIEEILDTTKLKVVFGHIIDQESCLSFCNRQIYLFTILRDPIKRVASHYYHYKRGCEYYNFNIPSLEDFLKVRARNNLMCSMITTKFSLFLDDEDLNLPLHQRAIKILKSFNFICLTEEFDLMINLLFQDIGIEFKTTDITRANIGSKNKQKDFLDLELIRKYNHEDISLYNYFVESRKQNKEVRNPFVFCHKSYIKGLENIFNSPYFSTKDILKKRFVPYAKDLKKYSLKGQKSNFSKEIFMTKQRLFNNALKLECFMNNQESLTDLEKELIASLQYFSPILEKELIANKKVN